MLEFRQGDLFEVEADIYVNTVNCVGVMGKGVALEFKQRFPFMYEEYRILCEEKILTPGGLFVWEKPPTAWIINFATKKHWKDPSQYMWVSLGLKKLKEYLLEYPKASIAMPALGCGNGGLQWIKVKEMIEKGLKDLPNKIYVFAPQETV